MKKQITKPKRELTKRTFNAQIVPQKDSFWKRAKLFSHYTPTVWIENPHLLKLFQGKQIKITVELVK